MKPESQEPVSQAGAQGNIPTQWNGQLTVKQLADEAEMEVNRFEREFKATHGIAPKQWIRQQRLLAAIERLAKGESIKRVAVTLHYYNTSHFSVDFKIAFGISPRKFMAAFQGRGDKALTLERVAFLEVSPHFYNVTYLTNITDCAVCYT